MGGAAGLFFLLLWLLGGCTAPPSGLSPVRDFDLERYLGRWYEIARLDHRFERGLTNVTAEYSRAPDGAVVVVNRGFDRASGKWREARGEARLLGDAQVGSLEVSFFGPFWAGYHVIALDREGYAWAMVTGPSRSYLWILSRRPTLDARILTRLVAKAKEWGFETKKLVIVQQNGFPAR